MFNFLHNFLPQPILFQFGFLTVHWYGVLIVLGIIVGLLVVLKQAKRLGISSDEVYNLAFYLVIFGLLGGRIYAVLLNLDFYLKNPFEIVAIWHGGLAIHGAIIGGVLTLVVYCRRKKQLLWQWLDLIALALSLGQAIGRFGNYFNQEIFGKPTSLPWGIPIAFQNRPLSYIQNQYFHPAFLYESILNLLNFFLLLFLFPRLRQKSGTLAFIYLINYSLIRIAMEFFRIDLTPEIFGLRLPIVVSIMVIISSLFILVYRKKAA